jgi:hypothetical protein
LRVHRVLMFVSSLLALLAAALNSYATYCVHCQRRDAGDPLELHAPDVRQAAASIDAGGVLEPDDAVDARDLSTAAVYLAAAFFALAVATTPRRRPPDPVQS